MPPKFHPCTSAEPTTHKIIRELYFLPSKGCSPINSVVRTEENSIDPQYNKSIQVMFLIQSNAKDAGVFQWPPPHDGYKGTNPFFCCYPPVPQDHQQSSSFRESPQG